MVSEHDSGMRHAYYGAISDLGLLALKGGSRSELFARSAELVQEAVGTDFAKILELQPDGALLLTAGVGWPDALIGEFEIPDDGDSQATYAMRLREPVVVENLLEEQRFTPHPVFLELGVRSGVNVVIEGAERPYGILEVDARSPRTYNEHDIKFLQLVANVLGSAVDRELRDRERDQFFGAVAHEIRNPLTSVHGFASRLYRTLQTGETVTTDLREEVEILHDQVVRLTRAVELVFQLTRVERPHALARDPIDLVLLVRNLVNEVRLLYPEIEFEEHYGADEVIVEADQAAVRAAFRNLIENAAKYSRMEPRRVQVSVAAAAGPDSEVVMLVGDSCGGLSGDELKHMFEQNYRGKDRGTASGLGIGLYLALRVCSAFGWRLDVENFPGEKCEMMVAIPAEAVEITE